MESSGLNWKRFNGTVLEYQNLIQLFEQADIKELEGCEGLTRVAEKVFEEDKVRTYSNVSNMAEILPGGSGAFENLNWSRNCL